MARSGVLFALLPTSLSPPKEDPLCRFTCFLRRQQKRRKERPKASAAAPTDATAMPAVCALLSTGLGEGIGAVDAGAAMIEEEGGGVTDEDEERVGVLLMVFVLDAIKDERSDEEVESFLVLEVMLVERLVLLVDVVEAVLLVVVTAASVAVSIVCVPGTAPATLLQTSYADTASS